MGVYVFNRSVLNTFADGEYMDLPTVVQNLVNDDKQVKVFLSDNEWLDIGRPEDYAHATERFQQLRDKFLPTEDSQIAL